MKTILVDDEPWTMIEFREECSELSDIEIVGEFLFAEDALEYARHNKVEFALLDIEMKGMNGVELARELRKLYPEIIIVFVTSHSKYLKDFIDVKGDYYVFKPYSRQDVQDALQRAKFYSGRLKKRIRACMFGAFDVYVDGKVMGFTSAKAKELLALLIEKRGGVVTPEEAMNCLYDGRTYDRGKSSTYRMNVLRLRESLKEAGIDNLLCSPVHGRGKYIDVSQIDCDLYDYLDGDAEGRRKFNGQYLTGYSWGETMLAALVWNNNEEEG
jgi:two-component SAPR family response regulator